MRGAGVQVQHGGQEGSAPTLATRTYALQLLLSLLDATAEAAPREAAASFLRRQAQAIVQCAFAAIEDSAETLKPDALEVLGRVLDTAAAVQGAAAGTPPEAGGGAEADDGLQMDVLAAPYVTALKSCLRPDAPVATATAAVRLAEVVLHSGMLTGDQASLQVPHPRPPDALDATAGNTELLGVTTNSSH